MWLWIDLIFFFADAVSMIDEAVCTTDFHVHDRFTIFMFFFPRLFTDREGGLRAFRFGANREMSRDPVSGTTAGHSGWGDTSR